jgi:hypothetical protein
VYVYKRLYIYRPPPPACQYTGGVPIPPPRGAEERNRPLGSAAVPVLRDLSIDNSFNRTNLAGQSL